MSGWYGKLPTTKEEFLEWYRIKTENSAVLYPEAKKMCLHDIKYRPDWLWEQAQISITELLGDGKTLTEAWEVLEDYVLIDDELMEEFEQMRAEKAKNPIPSAAPSSSYRSATSFCRSCGASFDAGDTFCGSCGRAV